MAALSVPVPFPVFADRDGQPLDAGKIYIGTANLDPVTNPIQVYYDEALTLTASQPLITSGGYIYRNGTPTNVYVDASEFSITVNDSKDLLVYTSVDGGPSGTWPINITGNAATATSATTATTATSATIATTATTATSATNATNAANLITTSFSIVESGGILYIKYGSTNIAKITSTGAITALNNVTGYGTV